MVRSTLTRGWHLFRPILAGGSLNDRVLASLGAMAGIAFAVWICAFAALAAGLPAIMGPIAASSVLLFAVPASPMGQPWAIIGGNTVSALVGIAMAQGHLPLPLAAGLAVAGAILAMSLLRCLHPPGGAVALTALIGGPAVIHAGWWFALIPVAINSAALVAAGLVYHRWSGHSYPHRPVPVAGHVLSPAPTPSPPLYHADLDRALADLGETYDVSREDLELLFQRMTAYAAERER